MPVAPGILRRGGVGSKGRAAECGAGGRGGVSLLLTGCAIASRSSFTLDPDFQADAWARITVLPFGGIPAYSRTAAEHFAFRLGGQPHFKIIDPGIAETTARRAGVPLRTAAGDLPTSEAVRIAVLTGAHAVFLGTVTVQRPTQAR